MGELYRSSTHSCASSEVIFIVMVLSVILTFQFSIRECDDYEMTSHVEEEEEEDEEVVRRKKTKRNFDDYVLGMLL